MLKIIGLGAFAAHLTQGAQRALQTPNAAIFLQTEHCYLAEQLRAQGTPFTCLDGLYEQAEDFDALNALIADAVCGRADQSDTLYALPGNPMEYKIVGHICALRDDVQLFPSVSYTSAALSALRGKVDGCGAQHCFAGDLPEISVDTHRALAVGELDNALSASQVKQTLSRYYPDEWTVYLCNPDDDAQTYLCAPIPLFALDRQPRYDHTTCVVCPPVPLLRKAEFTPDDLPAIVRQLRAPGGCAWDAKQTIASLKKDLLEECYELCEAIDRNDPYMLCEELGDVSLLVAMLTQIASEHGDFDRIDVSTEICKKLIFRHPHVFGEDVLRTPEAVAQNWEARKRQEKGHATTTQAMQAVCKALPALIQSEKIQKKAAAVGFDWATPQEALAKVREETAEVAQALQDPQQTGLQEELGDLLFAVVNVARLSKQSSEDALAAACEKFINRFAWIERICLQNGTQVAQITPAARNELWEKSKHTPT